MKHKKLSSLMVWFHHECVRHGARRSVRLSSDFFSSKFGIYTFLFPNCPLTFFFHDYKVPNRVFSGFKSPSLYAYIIHQIGIWFFGLTKIFCHWGWFEGYKINIGHRKIDIHRELLNWGFLSFKHLSSSLSSYMWTHIMWEPFCYFMNIRNLYIVH